MRTEYQVRESHTQKIPSQFPRNRHTVALWMAHMDRQRGERIAELRLARAWTQRQLADRLQVDPKTVHNWEKGRELNPANLHDLAELFDVTPDYIRNGNGETPDLDAIFGSAEAGRLRQLEQDMATVRDTLTQILERLERMDAARAGRAASSGRQANQRKTAGSQRKRPAKKKRRGAG